MIERVQPSRSALDFIPQAYKAQFGFSQLDDGLNFSFKSRSGFINTDRFPLLLEDLASLPLERGIVVEGFGLLPELLTPILFHPHQALWLTPTKSFKRDSMTRRDKPSFGPQVSDLERVKNNLFARDMLFTEYIKSQVLQYDYTLYEVDGTRTADEMADLLEGYFAPFLIR